MAYLLAQPQTLPGPILKLIRYDWILASTSTPRIVRFPRPGHNKLVTSAAQPNASKQTPGRIPRIAKALPGAIFSH